MPSKVTAPSRIVKHPNETLLMRVDFTAQLGSGESLVASDVLSVTVVPETLTVDPPEIDGTSKVMFRVSDGVEDEDYKLTVTVETNQGNTRIVPCVLEVREAAMAGNPNQTATALHFQSQPGSSPAGVNIGTVRVTVLNASGKVVNSNSQLVTLTVVGGSFASGGPTAVVQAVKGVATFTGLTINETGSYSLVATAAGLTSATSNSFNITPGTATHLAIEQSPLSGDEGQLLSPSLVVEIRDAFNNVVTSNTSLVVVSVASGPGAFTGSTTSVNAVAGVATFSNLKLNTEGVYTLLVADGDPSDGLLLATATGNILVGDVDEPELVSGQLTQGWATFGQVLPQGQAYDALQIGDLPTQTDIKDTWDDGSIKHAVVTAYVPTTASYEIAESSTNPGTFTPTLPTASVKFTINGTLWTASLPATHSSDVWFDGPLMKEEWFLVTPKDSQNNLHPLLKVRFAARMYSDGKGRVGVIAGNNQNKAGAETVVYSNLEVVVNGSTVFTRTNVTHYWLTQWYETFAVGGLVESDVTQDFTPFYEAGALPQFLETIANTTSVATGAAFNLLTVGGITNDMSSPGGHPELAILPSWQATYLVHGTKAQRDYVIAQGRRSASWPKRVEESDGSLWTINNHPNYWHDSRGAVGQKPLSGVICPAKPDVAHQPSLAYLPYLITGDRFFADELAAWAQYTVLTAHPTSRGGVNGLLWPHGQVRAIGWGTRALTDAAAYLPESWAIKAQIATLLQKNLDWCEAQVPLQGSPLGFSFDDYRPENKSNPAYVFIAQWEHNYLAWAIDHAHKQGFTGGGAMLNRIVACQLSLFTAGDAYPKLYAAPYTLVTGTRSGTTKTYYQSLGDIFQVFYLAPNPDRAPQPFQGYYGADARLMLMIAIEQGLSGAQTAYDYLHPIVCVTPYIGGVADLNQATRCGWAVKVL